ncbi:hypothetical protein [Ruegeria arenilitoris]|uniref:hypothetical protein n=1 Tax=Ruegeria arenilitoris TaxID=1173585 RepID=UPI00147D0B39|nr:hypothetical protein [Ruegeria arenilitoris]
MGDLETTRLRLEQVFASYARLSNSEQEMAVDMMIVMLRQMLRLQNGKRQKLTELGSKNKASSTSHVEKARRKLVRKSNSSSPQPPIKPVQTTKKNELRRK